MGVLRTRRIACLGWMLLVAGGADGFAATLSDKSRESGCVSKPVVVGGTLYKCRTAAGTDSYFNVPGAAPETPRETSREAPEKRATAPSSPASFPRVDTATQKGRDDKRRQLLADELSAEEKLLAEARLSYADGAPVALPEERKDAEKYRERIARLRQAVVIHQKNIEALRKELAAVR